MTGMTDTKTLTIDFSRLSQLLPTDATDAEIEAWIGTIITDTQRDYDALNPAHWYDPDPDGDVKEIRAPRA